MLTQPMPNNNPEEKSLPPSKESTDARRKARNQRVQTIIKYMGLSGSGLGLSGIVGFLRTGNWQLALASGTLTIAFTIIAIAYKFVSGVTNRVLDKIEEELENAEEPLATWIVKGLKIFVIDFWWSFNPQFQRSYYRSLIEYFREFKIEGFRIGLPVLDLEDVFVPLRVDPEIPENISGGMIRAHSQSESQTIWDFLAQSTKNKFSNYRRLAVIGSPGSGKTTLLRHLTLTYAKKQHGKYKAPQFIPILLYLRDIRNSIVAEPRPSLPQLIKEHIHNLPAPQTLTPPPRWVKEQLKIGNLLVMLDGLDEVADESQRQQVSHWVNRQMQIYRQTAFILTSRPHGYRSAPVEQVGTVLEVLPFNSEQMQQFIRSWYVQTEIMSRAGRDTPAVRAEAKNNADNLIERIISNRAISDMAKNPLLVTMIATVHYCGSALPGRRVELYQKICDLLLGSRQKAKKIESPLTAEQNKSVLQVLALGLMQRQTREFTPQVGQELIAGELERVAGNSLNSDQFLEQIKHISGLLVERELGVYEFAHLSFQEYLAAAQVKELQQDIILVENLDNPWWTETIRLYAAQGDATNLIQKAIENLTVTSLTLALDCLQESLKVEPTVREQLEEILEEGLESPDSQIAELAAEVKLSRRLNNLREIDENLEIDSSYITYAEYQLFVDERLNSQFHFQPGSAKRAITGISWQNALEFCNWLRLKPRFLKTNSDGVFYFRLPTTTEVRDNPTTQYPQLGCWQLEGGNQGENGIRVVRAKIPHEYIKLFDYLIGGEVEKASEETKKVILKAAKREIEGSLDITSIQTLPCSCLHTIDNLWIQFSRGCYGWGMGKIVDSDVNSGNAPYFWWLNASGNIGEVFSSLVRKYSDCGRERALPLSVLDIVTVNYKGEEIQRQYSQVQYFTEDLGNNITLDIVAIPGGTFIMGAPGSEHNSRVSERPQHQVNVPPFFMGKYPVTQAQWKAVAALPKVNRDLEPNPSHFKGNNRPVEKVCWYDAVEFCARLSRKTRQEYRLPSEAEWEYACRAGTTTPFHFGETITTDLANYNGEYTCGNAPRGKNRKQATTVASFLPNAFGLYDMHGNVWEWCLDDWHNNYEDAPTNGSPWFDKNGNLFQKTGITVLRGGSWGDNPRYCRSAYRCYNNRAEHDYSYGNIGFRVVCGFGRTFK
ncbi:MAG: SUMF1/EgtB/PvdO family nonheme iron enzyme [Calothrix sp. MO_167.B42]|nr:SUMF1/EgtB/PvdO family nonheme iron enzyme [Calothrix sp. MO_167.B42]